MKQKVSRALLAAFVVAAAFPSCTKKTDGSAKTGAIKIGISKIVAHPALDAVEQGVVDGVRAAGIEAEFDLQNANGDTNTAAQIAAQFKNQNVNFAVGIATPTAIALAENIKDIPVLFSAVTDPVGAGLVDSVGAGKNNVTGASDAISVPAHVRLFKDVAGIKTLGYIYTSSEDNSISSLADVREACRAEGLELVIQAITNSAELKQAAESIISRVDGVYITNDNTVYAALPSLIEVCRRNKKPLFSADVTSCKEGGAFIALGFNYYKVGVATAEIIKQIVDGKKPSEIPVRFMTDPKDQDFLIDLDEAANCGITVDQKFIAQANMIYQNGTLTEK